MCTYLGMISFFYTYTILIFEFILNFHFCEEEKHVYTICLITEPNIYRYYKSDYIHIYDQKIFEKKFCSNMTKIL